MTDSELVDLIEDQKALMIDVATGGTRIQEVNNYYRVRRSLLRQSWRSAGWKIRAHLLTCGLGTAAGAVAIFRAISPDACSPLSFTSRLFELSKMAMVAVRRRQRVGLEWIGRLRNFVIGLRMPPTKNSSSQSASCAAKH